jgi:crotonobetainyl-CoA:carnitine CoA-transferase CaiB-like acyl-CoA transferase
MRTPVTSVPAPSAVLASAQYAARGYWVDDGDVRLPSTPFRLASGAFAPFRPAHRPGADTADVLATLDEVAS